MKFGHFKWYQVIGQDDVDTANGAGCHPQLPRVVGGGRFAAIAAAI